MCGASALVGMHPDQATEPIVDCALRHRVPFAIVPCCVFAREFPKLRPGGGGLVTTYEELLDYLQAKAPGIRRAYLPFVGRNVVLWHRPEEPPREGEEEAPSEQCQECEPG